MMAFLQGMFDLSAYEAKTDREKALFIYAVTFIGFVATTIFIALIPTAGDDGSLTYLQDAFTGRLESLISIVLFYGIIGSTYILNRIGRIDLSSGGVLVMIYIIGILPVILDSRNTAQPSATAILCILIVTSGFLYQEIGVIGGISVSLATLWLMHDPLLFSEVPLLTILLLVISLIIYAYIRYTRVDRIQGSQEAILERLKLATITTEIASLTLERTDINTVLKQGLDLIQEGYTQFYHAQVFLLDDAGRNAKLVSSTGEAGRALIQRQHSIGVGSQSVIGQATLRNVHIISKANDSVHKRNEFLSETVIEAAFPLRLGTQVIGALDLQSKQNLELSETDLFTFQSLANNFALAIDNVRQFESAEARIQENQRLAEQASQSLQEIDRLNKRLMEQAWSEYMTSQHDQLGLNIDFENNTIEESSDWSDSLKQAIQDGNMSQTDQSDERLITIPLKIRGQVIGAMEFELDENNSIDPSDLTLIQEVSERFGLAAENTRLVEESQRVAQREALINEIGSRLQSTNNVESTLTEAVRSIGSVLNANRVSIRLLEPEDDPLHNRQL